MWYNTFCYIALAYTVVAGREFCKILLYFIHTKKAKAHDMAYTYNVKIFNCKGRLRL